MSNFAELLTKHRYRAQDYSTIDGRAYCFCGWSQLVVNTHKTAIVLHAEHVESEIVSKGMTVLDVEPQVEYGVEVFRSDLSRVVLGPDERSVLQLAASQPGNVLMSRHVYRSPWVIADE
jgi:hypothetical protein